MKRRVSARGTGRRVAYGAAAVLIASCARSASEPCRGAPGTIGPCGGSLMPATAAPDAEYTMGARTVVIQGPERTLQEAGIVLVTQSYAYLLPSPYDGAPDPDWRREQAARPDLLAIAASYLGVAHYGPPMSGGGRNSGADFNDFLGIPWTYPDGVDPPEPEEKGSVDCSGFVRLVYGYRGGYPLGSIHDIGASALPRTAAQMFEAPLGLAVHRIDELHPGDLVFFDASDRDGREIDHVGIYLGEDVAGHHRFVSSRISSNGPTMGDFKGASTLDGDGLFARSFRGGRRL